MHVFTSKLHLVMGVEFLTWKQNLDAYFSCFNEREIILRDGDLLVAYNILFDFFHLVSTTYHVQF